MNRAKVGAQVGECFLDGFSECSYAQALNFLQDENRWASDFELADSKQQIQAAIGTGSSRVGSTLQSLGGLTGSSLDRLAREEDNASDSEFFSSMATLQSQIAELSDLSCHVEQLARLPHSERSTIPPRCDPTGASGSKRAAKRSSTSSKHERIREPQPRTLQTLQLELALVGATPLATNPATVSQLDEVKRLVWDTIRAQRRLAISPAATSASERTARDADRLMLAGQIQRSFEVYQQAYRTLVTGN